MPNYKTKQKNILTIEDLIPERFNYEITVQHPDKKVMESRIVLDIDQFWFWIQD